MEPISRRRMIELGATATVGVGSFAAFQLLSGASEASTLMTPPEALEAAASGQILLVDIRRPEEWAETGVPEHAVPIDMRADDFLTQLSTARASDTQPVAVICARGVRSARLAGRLAEAGIGPIIDVPEGMLGSFAGPGWLKRGLPVV